MQSKWPTTITIRLSKTQRDHCRLNGESQFVRRLIDAHISALPWEQRKPHIAPLDKRKTKSYTPSASRSSRNSVGGAKAQGRPPVLTDA